jgi:hypothetical protein
MADSNAARSASRRPFRVRAREAVRAYQRQLRAWAKRERAANRAGDQVGTPRGFKLSPADQRRFERDEHLIERRVQKLAERGLRASTHAAQTTP